MHCGSMTFPLSAVCVGLRALARSAYLIMKNYWVILVITQAEHYIIAANFMLGLIGLIIWSAACGTKAWGMEKLLLPVTVIGARR